MWPVGFISVGIWEREPAARWGDADCSAVLGYQHPRFCCHKELRVRIQNNLSQVKSTLPNAVLPPFLARGSHHLPCTSNTVLKLQWEVWETKPEQSSFLFVWFSFYLVLVYLPEMTDCRFGAREGAAMHKQAGMKQATGTTAVLIQSCKIVLELLWLM